MADFTLPPAAPTDTAVETLRAMNAGLVINVEELREELWRARDALSELADDFRILRDCSPSAKWAAFAGESVERIEKALARVPERRAAS